jgi:hypothetical protein
MTTGCFGCPRFSARSTTSASSAARARPASGATRCRRSSIRSSRTRTGAPGSSTGSTAGYQAFRTVYVTCTPAATLAIDRYVEEGAKIARDIAARYGKEK